MENLISINTEYQAGVCNIGPSEIAKRKHNFYISLLGTIISFILLIFLELSQLWKLFIFVPLFITMVTYLQVRNKFCVTFGYLSVVNFGEKPIAKELRILKITKKI
ncbi:MAG: hypothetical protein GPJ54_16475 [Candidatus Heimdallarchaeota archaeon]|nr:hypothetical protein [Candidatus Heimdallarchaeota archaeon]